MEPSAQTVPDDLSGIYIGTTVDQKGNALCGRNQRSKRWSPDSFDPAYDHLPSYQYRTCASRGNKGIGLLFFTRFNPTTIEESFFFWIAMTGGSAVSIT
mgnify:CR=1 FL=1